MEMEQEKGQEKDAQALEAQAAEQVQKLRMARLAELCEAGVAWRDTDEARLLRRPGNLSDMRSNGRELVRQILEAAHECLGHEAREGWHQTMDGVLKAALAGGDGTDKCSEVAVLAHLQKEGLVGPPREAPCARPATHNFGARADVVLRLAGETRGSLLSKGTCAVLGAESNIGKSALTTSIAVALASLPEKNAASLKGGIFEAPSGGGPVLLAQYEDEAPETQWRLRELVKVWGQEQYGPALGRVHLLDMKGLPLYGQGLGSNGQTAPPTTAPVALAGWTHLCKAVEQVTPLLVVVDPALGAYSGNANDGNHVRVFLDALSDLGKEKGFGTIVVAHSTKASRGARQRNEAADPFDPGMIGGSSHWMDRPRGALTLTWDDERGWGRRRLGVAKSNYGLGKVLLSLDTIRAVEEGKKPDPEKGAIIGFEAAKEAQWNNEALEAKRAVESILALMRKLKAKGVDLAPIARAAKRDQGKGPKGGGRKSGGGGTRGPAPGRASEAGDYNMATGEGLDDWGEGYGTQETGNGAFDAGPVRHGDDDAASPYVYEDDDEIA